ncbi:hypothetical protein BP6252_12791 [Coleophoma cylindrospora]|uniref:N-acetylglucosamine-induced protein 1 n=1 Tax=Coleophoma cylindrospora TaxID=1849047 RepID=A0A3D8QE48_9HELO|nr:hypothetical protein BP6252_12791 [Coleophoma cylindrospora]
MKEANLEQGPGPVKEAASPFPLTDTDKWVLSLTDEQFKLHSWDELKEIIAQNRLEVLKRKPSDLRRYMAWSVSTNAQYGSMTNYLLAHRLPQSWGRPPFTPNSLVPFEDKSDYSILVNDWPYGLEKGISHIVVWSRTPIETDEKTGDVTDLSRARIQDFVKRTFMDRLSEDGSKRVMWFKNWVALQSVRSLEHFHVLVRDAEPDDLKSWTKQEV